MIASGLMPRSPVWLRKIPSTVSGSQGSRRGFAPAVRFAFPLGARMYITGFPAPGQGKVRIRPDLLRRAGGFRRSVGVFPARAIVTAGALPPVLVEEPPQPGGAGTGVPARFPRRSAPPSDRSGRDGKMPLRRDPPRATPAPPTASCYVQRRCARAAQAMMRRRRESWCRRRIGDMPATAIRQCPRLQSRGKERDARPQRALARRRRQRRRLRAPPSSPKAQGGVPIVLSIDLLANFARWGQRCRGPRKGPALFLFQSAR